MVRHIISHRCPLQRPNNYASSILIKACNHESEIFKIKFREDAILNTSIWYPSRQICFLPKAILLYQKEQVNYHLLPGYLNVQILVFLPIYFSILLELVFEFCSGYIKTSITRKNIHGKYRYIFVDGVGGVLEQQKLWWIVRENSNTSNEIYNFSLYH